MSILRALLVSGLGDTMVSMTVTHPLSLRNPIKKDIILVRVESQKLLVGWSQRYQQSRPTSTNHCRAEQ